MMDAEGKFQFCNRECSFYFSILQASDKQFTRQHFGFDELRVL
jgi:hypothetical protein